MSLRNDDKIKSTICPYVSGFFPFFLRWKIFKFVVHYSLPLWRDEKHAFAIAMAVEKRKITCQPAGGLRYMAAFILSTFLYDIVADSQALPQEKMKIGLSCLQGFTV